MTVGASPTYLDAIANLREMYRGEMRCQIVHDSIHYRTGWTDEYVLHLEGAAVGYGSVAIGGPWAKQPSIYEVYVIPEARQHLFPLFESLITVSGATHVEVQSNDALSTIFCHAYVPAVESEAILFDDRVTTTFQPAGATFRTPRSGELDDVSPAQQPWHGVVELGGEVAATGGILFHYNPPYGDVYMQVSDRFRRRGLGTFIVQELKRVARAGGFIPVARTGVSNIASQRTLQRAGFVPCGHIIKGALGRP